MSNKLDPLNGRPISQWVLCPPEIYVAGEKFILRTYDVVTDENLYDIAMNGDELHAKLRAWADDLHERIMKSFETKVKALTHA